MPELTHSLLSHTPGGKTNNRGEKENGARITQATVDYQTLMPELTHSLLSHTPGGKTNNRGEKEGGARITQDTADIAHLLCQNSLTITKSGARITQDTVQPPNTKPNTHARTHSFSTLPHPWW